MCVSAVLGLVSCDDNDYPYVPQGYGTLSVELQTIPDAPLADITLYFFNAEGDVVASKSHTSQQGIFPDYTPLPPGDYTVVMVAGVPGGDLPDGDASLQGLAEWLMDNEPTLPGMMTANAYATVNAGEMTRVFLNLSDGYAGTGLTTVSLSLTVPGLNLPAYTATRTDGKQLRCVVEAYRAGTNDKAYSRTLPCALQEDGTFLAELSLMPGVGKVLVLTDSYVANGETDKKDAYYSTTTLSVPSSPTGELRGLFLWCVLSPSTV